MFKSFPSTIITQKLQEHKMHGFLVPSLVVLDASSHYHLLVFLKSDFLLPNVEFLRGLICVDPLKHISNLSVSFTPKIFVLSFDHILLPMGVELETIQLFVLLYDELSKLSLIGEQLVLV